MPKTNPQPTEQADSYAAILKDLKKLEKRIQTLRTGVTKGENKVLKNKDKRSVAKIREAIGKM